MNKFKKSFYTVDNSSSSSVVKAYDVLEQITYIICMHLI